MKIFIIIMFNIIVALHVEATKLEIINYQPTKYIELADEPFFYTIGKTLRYGKTINPKAPILFKGDFFGGELIEIYPSPDNKKAIILTKHRLYLITPTQPAKLMIKDIDSYAAPTIKEGSYFFMWFTLKWNETSDYIYIVRYKKRKSIWETSKALDRTLMRINIDDPTKVNTVMNNFSADDYYFVGADTICFNYAPGNGDLVWTCTYKSERVNVKLQTEDGVILANNIILNKKPFLTIRSAFGSQNIPEYGFFLKNMEKGIEGFFSNSYGEKPIFKIKTAHNIKGHTVDGISESGSNILPGGRYVLLNVLHKNFRGQLLVDGLTGKYKELPSNTKVYMSINSFNYKNFHFKYDSINSPTFTPATKFRQVQGQAYNLNDIEQLQ